VALLYFLGTIWLPVISMGKWWVCYSCCTYTPWIFLHALSFLALILVIQHTTYNSTAVSIFFGDLTELFIICFLKSKMLILHKLLQTADQFFAFKVPMRDGELNSLCRGLDKAFQVYTQLVTAPLGLHDHVLFFRASWYLRQIFSCACLLNNVYYTSIDTYSSV